MIIFQTLVVERHPLCKSTVLLTGGIFLGGDNTSTFQVFGLDWLDHCCCWPICGRFLRDKFYIGGWLDWNQRSSQLFSSWWHSWCAAVVNPRCVHWALSQFSSSRLGMSCSVRGSEAWILEPHLCMWLVDWADCPGHRRWPLHHRLRPVEDNSHWGDIF